MRRCFVLIGGKPLSSFQGVNNESDGGDAGLEIPTDCLKQPSSTSVGLIWNGKMAPCSVNQWDSCYGAE